MEPLGFPADQGIVLQALGNIQQTVDAADARVQQAGDEVILTLQEALKQSDQTNRDLAGRLSLAMERFEALANRMETIETLRQTEKTASEERINALQTRYEERINALQQSLQEHGGKLHQLRTEMDNAKTNFAIHDHFIPDYTGIPSKKVGRPLIHLC